MLANSKINIILGFNFWETESKRIQISSLSGYQRIVLDRTMLKRTTLECYVWVICEHKIILGVMNALRCYVCFFLIRLHSVLFALGWILIKRIVFDQSCVFVQSRVFVAIFEIKFLGTLISFAISYSLK